jgi:hypothetical protein
MDGIENGKIVGYTHTHTHTHTHAQREREQGSAISLVVSFVISSVMFKSFVIFVNLTILKMVLFILYFPVFNFI